MKKNSLRFLCVLLALLTTVVFTSCQTSSEADSPWCKTWAVAAEKAENSEKNILVFFSQLAVDEEGNPINKESTDLNEAFGKKSFKKKVADEFVLLNIDLSDPETMDYGEYMEGLELTEKFVIQSIPSIIIATPEQYVIDYIIGPDMQQNPSKIISKLGSFVKKSKAVTKARKELVDAQDLDKLKAIDKLIQSLSPAYRNLTVNLLSQIKEMDPDNQSGLLTKYALSFAYVDAIGEFGSGNVQGAIDIFINVAESEGVSNADAQEAYWTSCYLMANTGIGTPEVVLETMKKALEKDPNSKMASDIKNPSSIWKR